MAKDNYGGLLDRIQEEIDIEDITPDRIAKYLAEHDTKGKTLGRRKLGTILSNLLSEERAIAQTISLTDDFAKEREIELSEKTRGGIYEKWGRYGRRAIVIFMNGKIKAWKYID